MKMRWIIGMLLLAACSGFAQTATRIDGRQHPELIPDNAAYRSVFMMQSHFETSEATARSEQFHTMIGFTPADHKIYDDVLQNFRRQYDSQVGLHNAFLDSASAPSFSEMHEEVSRVRKSLSLLVETARAELSARMTANGTAKLDAFVKSEKTHMVVGVRSGR